MVPSVALVLCRLKANVFINYIIPYTSHAQIESFLKSKLHPNDIILEWKILRFIPKECCFFE